MIEQPTAMINGEIKAKNSLDEGGGLGEPQFPPKYKYPLPTPPADIDETEISKLEKFLENEKGNSHNESWNKLDNGIKMQKLHAFAETHGRETKLTTKEVKQLKMFFNDCLEKNKLKKAKDVVYDKMTGIIQSVPALAFNSSSKNFTLRNLDTKRVSTLKSLTPKKIAAAVETD